MSDEVVKVRPCQACGKDCTGQPRIKDKKGRYLHKACYEKAKAKAKAKKEAALAAAASETEDIYGLEEAEPALSEDMFGDLPSQEEQIPQGFNTVVAQSTQDSAKKERRKKVSAGAALAGASWVLALVGACGGGLLGIIAWSIKVNLIEREYYFALLGVGFLVGTGAALLSGSRKGVMSGMIAACVALAATPLAIVTAYAVLIDEQITESVTTQSANWEETWMTDLEAKTLLAGWASLRAERQDVTLEWPSGYSFETAYEFLHHPRSITGPIRDEWNAMDEAARESKKDEIVEEREVSNLADQWAYQKEEAGEQLNWPQGMSYADAYLIEDYPQDLVASARTYWNEMSRAEQVQHVTASYARFGAMMSSPEGTVALMESELETKHLLWYGGMIILSVITAFGIGSGMSTDEETA